jgi:hypothetical protein
MSALLEFLLAGFVIVFALALVLPPPHVEWP